MSPEVALLHDTWEGIKSTFPRKKDLTLQKVVRIFDDNVDISEVEEVLWSLIIVMKAAVVPF